MRKLYNEFFYIPKHGKIREKVMLTRIAMTITIMVICLAAMSITAYAYFLHNVTSGSNTIQAANFEANVLITITNSNNDLVAVTKDGKVQTTTLDVGEYTVLLTKDKGTSTATTGFCIITIGDTDYFTQQIGNDVGRGITDGSASVEFTLKVSSATKIEILSHWGTSKYYGYKDESGPDIFIDSTGFFLDLTNGDSDKSEDNTEQSEETTTATSTDTTTPTSDTESSTPTTETTTPAETTTPETTGTSEPTTSTSTEPTVAEPTVTEPAATESTDTTESTETQPVEETTGAPTIEVSE